MVEIYTIEERKEALKVAATYLSKVPNASKRLLFVADSINKYLNEDESTLDHAFGLKAKRGQYIRVDNEDHINLVCNALKARWENPPKSWKIISELSGYDGYFMFDFDLDTCRTFTRVTSAFYPELESYYQETIENWYQNCLSELKEEDGDDDED